MDSAMQQILIKLLAQEQPQTVAAYWPYDGEPDLLPTLKSLPETGITVVLPVTQPSAKIPTMVFRQWSPATEMKNSRFGIPQPVGTSEVLLRDIDMVLMPLVAWDESGGRIGMGGGFYDRALQAFSQAKLPLRVGVGYQLQKVPRFATGPWDVYLHLVLTESGLFNPDTRHEKQRKL